MVALRRENHLKCEHDHGGGEKGDVKPDF